MKVRFVVGFLMLCACRKEQTATWMEGGSFGWDAFNHRFGHVTLQAGADKATVAALGGTSTTGVITELPDECDPDVCAEFPIFDDAAITVDWARASTKHAAFGTAVTTMTADADGEIANVVIDIADPIDGTPVVILTGFSFDTNHALSEGEACYNPGNGWLPRRIAVLNDGASVNSDFTKITLTVETFFEAGLSLEEVRQCLDEVADQAVVDVELHWLGLVIDQSGGVLAVQNAHASYDYGTKSEPVDQPPPTAAERPFPTFEGDNVLVGWNGFDFKLHVDDGDGRGAYLRTLDLIADRDGGIATGHATNYSPGTQLSGFSYSFEGSLGVADLGAEIERGTASGTFPAELDESGAPILHDIAY